MEPEHTNPTNAGEQSGGERRAPQLQPQHAPTRAAAAATRPDFYQGRIPEVSSEQQRHSNFKAASSGLLTTMAHQDVFLGKSPSPNEWNITYLYIYILPEG